MTAANGMIYINFIFSIIHWILFLLQIVEYTNKIFFFNVLTLRKIFSKCVFLSFSNSPILFSKMIKLCLVFVFWLITYVKLQREMVLKLFFWLEITVNKFHVSSIVQLNFKDALMSPASEFHTFVLMFLCSSYQKGNFSTFFLLLCLLWGVSFYTNFMHKHRNKIDMNISYATIKCAWLGLCPYRISFFCSLFLEGVAIRFFDNTRKG
jgi:hypothetical protein